MIKIKGVIFKITEMSTFSFIVVKTRKEYIQCIYVAEFAKFEINILQEGMWLEVEGLYIDEKRARAGYEIKIKGIKILAEPTEKFPITINKNNIKEGLTNKLDFRPISLRHPKEQAIFIIQAGIMRGFREYLVKEEFIEIKSPKIVSGSAEGGANVFKLDYFGKEAFLTQSPQFYKQIMVGVFERVYEIGPVFRAEKHNTSRHINEYISMDIEIGFIKSFYDVIDIEEKMLKYIFRFLKSNYKNEIDLLNIKIPEISNTPRIKFSSIKEILSKKYKKVYRDRNDLSPDEEKLICKYIYESTGSEFVFVTHYPTSKRPFYTMDSRENLDETYSFDLLFRGLEITTGGQRIHEYSMQVEKMLKLNMTLDGFESYLMAHKYGLPPHGGFGLGLERLTLKLLDYNNIRETTLFPRDIQRLTP